MHEIKHEGYRLLCRRDGSKPTPTTAKEAGIDRVTIYRFHEPTLVEIPKDHRFGAEDAVEGKPDGPGPSNCEAEGYRQLVEEAQKEVAALARMNYRLDDQISELEELIGVRGKVINGL